MGRKDRILETSLSSGASHKFFRLCKKKLYHRRAIQDSSRKESYRGGKTSLGQRLLQSLVCGPQIQWEMETNNRPEEAKRLCKNPQVQNGVSSVGLDSTDSGEFHFLHRPHRCVLPYSHSREIKEVPKTVLQRESLSVPGSPFRAKHSPVHIHSSSIRGESTGSPQRDTTLPISGRLAHPDEIVFGRGCTEQVSSGSVRRVGIDGQSPEIRTSPNAGLLLHRGEVQYPSSESVSKGREHSQTEEKTSQYASIKLSHCQKVSVSIGEHGIPIQIHKPSKTIHETGTMAPERELGSEFGQSVSAGPSHSTGQTVPKVVVGTVGESCGGPPPPTPVRHPYVHRCIRTGLGGTCVRCARNQIPGSLVTGGVISAHQCTRIESSETCLKSVHGSSSVSNTDCDRQYNSSQSHQQARGYSLLVVDGGDSEVVCTSDPKQLDNLGKTHSRASECDCRLSVKGRSNSPNGVEPSPSSCGNDFPSVGSASYRPICHKGQQKMSHVCVSSPRSGSLGSRRSVPKLPGSDSLCIPSNSDNSKDATKLPKSKRLLSDRGSAILAETVMVPHAKTAGSGKSHSTATVGKTAKAAAIRNIPSTARVSEAPRLVAEEGALRQQGFEQEVANRIANPLAGSTNKVYDAKWAIWEVWAKGQKINPLNPTIPEIASFLNKLFNDGQSVSSISGYRAALASALKFSTELDISNSAELSRLIKFCTRSRPPRSSKVPCWDLSLVLWTLLDSPFEPIWDDKLCPMKFLTWKVAFLLLLATGARRGELHAITKDNVSIHSDEKSEYMTLRPSPEFVSKTSLQKGVALQPFRIPSLRDLVGPASSDRKLCPVRAVKTYLHRTKSLRKDRKLLLLSYMQSGVHTEKEISVNTLSSWISQLIQFAYANPSKSAVKLSGKKAHELRAYSSSLVHKGCRSMEDVLAAGQWASPNVFIDHYLRDFSEQQDGLHRLGPIVAAQKVVQC